MIKNLEMQKWNLMYPLVYQIYLQARSFRPTDDDDDDSDDDFSDDEDLQSPIDEVDPFVFFMDTAKGNLNMHKHMVSDY